MPTNQQRAQAIADAILNTTATPAQLDRMGRALSAQDGRLAEYVAMTAAQKAELFVAKVRAWAVGVVRDHEERQAANEARATAAQSVSGGLAEAP